MSFYRWMKIRRWSIVSSKYVLAVILSLHVAYFLGVMDYLSTVFVSVLTLQPNLYRGLQFSLEQLKGTVLGAGITLLIIGLS
ncbi:MAG: aromatic acid exporter family protein, partial [bacterium]